MNFIHGKTKTPEFSAWSNMIQRCSNPNLPNFNIYGGRGIKVCDEWRESFAAFLTDVGPRPSRRHSIDRINTNGNYEPGNVRWATRREQQQNVRKNVLYTFNGETLCLREWERRTGIDHKVLKSRISRGLPPQLVMSPNPVLNPKTKLSAAQVGLIREMLAAGTTDYRLSKMFSVSHKTIAAIRTGKTWKLSTEPARARVGA